MSYLSLSNVRKSFGKSNVIPSFDLDVHQGEITALIGESGCGKTTILRMIAGLESLDAGTIHLAGKNITSVKPSKRSIGMVFQDLALFPHMTVSDNIAFGISAGAKTRVEELLELTDLEGLGGRYPHELSGGQKQRVALARSLGTNPKVLLLDEPFSNLDEMTHERVRTEIHQLIKELGITTILVTHHPIDSFMMADRVAILKKGKLLQLDTPDKIYQQPVDSYTAGFFGSCIILDGKSSPFGELEIAGDLLFIRPESVALSRNEGCLTGVVVDKLFKGPHEILVIENEAKSHTLNLETEHSDFAIGDQIYLQPKLDQIRTLTH